jgi:hypothetical protein
MSVAERQKIIRLLVREIVVEKDNVTVRHCIPLTGGVRDAAGRSEQSYPLCTWSNHGPLRSARFPRLPVFAALHHSLLQESPD